jgi:hypothetical protein
MHISEVLSEVRDVELTYLELCPICNPVLFRWELKLQASAAHQLRVNVEQNTSTQNWLNWLPPGSQRPCDAGGSTSNNQARNLGSNHDPPVCSYKGTHRGVYIAGTLGDTCDFRV